MASRQYKRKSNGQFAGNGDPGAKVTTGRAGGFASAAHRANVANKRAASVRRKAIAKKMAVNAGAAGAVLAVSAIGSRAQQKRLARKNSLTGLTDKFIKNVNKGATRATTKW